MTGSLTMTTDDMPVITHLLHAGAGEFEALMEATELKWGVANYVALEPLQKTILAEYSPERKIELLLHLARLRGGISDILEIVNLDLSDELQLSSSVKNTFQHL